MAMVRAGCITRVLLVAVLTHCLTACNDPHGTLSPASPSSVPPSAQLTGAPTAPRSAKGVRVYVSDTAFRALAGVRVEVVEGPEAGLAAVTDESGAAWFNASIEDATRFRGSKEGYLPSTEALALQAEGPAGNMWLILPAATPTIDISGDYSLTFIADPACTGIPENLRNRTYAATIAPAVDARNPVGTFFWAAIHGASFLAEQSRIPIGVAVDYVSFWLGEHGYGAFLVERVTPDSYLQFDGGAGVSVGTKAISTMSTTFQGSADYCVQTSEMGQYYACDPQRASTNVHCESNNHRLILSRR